MERPRSGFQHMTATKAYLKMVIERLGPHVLGDQFTRAEDAIAALDADPREVIPLGACDHQDEKGNCLGHDR